ncbi:MAG: hypothetical protein ACREYC_12710, partial [Gammaproteobacteria bacterium]
GGNPFRPHDRSLGRGQYLLHHYSADRHRHLVHCLVAAVAMLLQVPYSFDELLASGQFLLERRRQGQSLLRAFLFGDTIEGGSEGPRDEFAAPGRGGSLAASLAVGIWLMCTRLTFGSTSAQANSDHLLAR